MYEISCNVRFSETDRSGVMSMNGLLRLFQDVGYAHALERGFGLEFTKRTRCTWYLLSWQIEAFRMPAAGEHITLRTCIYDMRASLAHKSIAMYDSDGNCLALGDTMWVYVNVDRQEPAEPGQDTASGWKEEDFGDRISAPQGISAAGASASRRIRVPADAQRLADCIAEQYILDTNGHANNVRLTELAMRLAGADNGSCVRLRAEFKEQVKAQSVICPIIKKDTLHANSGIADTDTVLDADDAEDILVSTVAFKDTGGQVMAVFEFTQRQNKKAI